MCDICNEYQIFFFFFDNVLSMVIRKWSYNRVIIELINCEIIATWICETIWILDHVIIAYSYSAAGCWLTLWRSFWPVERRLLHGCGVCVLKRSYNGVTDVTGIRSRANNQFRAKSKMIRSSCYCQSSHGGIDRFFNDIIDWCWRWHGVLI